MGPVTIYHLTKNEPNQPNGSRERLGFSSAEYAYNPNLCVIQENTDL